MPSGGKRPGAGRKPNSGLYGEKTKVMRVPENRVAEVKDYLKRKIYRSPHIGEIKHASQSVSSPLTLYQSAVSAGFPSPADDFVEGKLDFNEHLIQNPAATFVVRVSGDSMINAGIFPNDLLVVDRSLEARTGKVVIAVINGELTVKRLIQKNGDVILQAENQNYKPIFIQENDDFQIWGVVTNVIHNL